MTGSRRIQTLLEETIPEFGDHRFAQGEYRSMQTEKHKPDRRVVVTGLGVVSSIGIGKDAYRQSLERGRSGIRKITTFDTSSYDCQIAGEITDFEPGDFMPAQTARLIDPFAVLALACA